MKHSTKEKINFIRKNIDIFYHREMKYLKHGSTFYRNVKSYGASFHYQKLSSFILAIKIVMLGFFFTLALAIFTTLGLFWLGLLLTVIFLVKIFINDFFNEERTHQNKSSNYNKNYYLFFDKIALKLVNKFNLKCYRFDFTFPTKDFGNIYYSIHPASETISLSSVSKELLDENTTEALMSMMDENLETALNEIISMYEKNYGKAIFSLDHKIKLDKELKEKIYQEAVEHKMSAIAEKISSENKNSKDQLSFLLEKKKELDDLKKN